MTPEQAARYIDISAVRTHHTLRDIEEVVGHAKEYGFINVHALPSWVKTLSVMLEDAEGVYVGAPVGFPSGGHAMLVKLKEAEQLIDDGVEEMDIVMNVGKFLNGEFGYVSDELNKIIALARQKPHVKTKVIIEMNVLTDEQAAEAARLIIDTGADFVKTGTGWVPGTANVERIRKLKNVCGSRIMIKAAGGIRTKEEFLTLVEMGVERMGINTKSALEIVESFSQ